MQFCSGVRQTDKKECSDQQTLGFSVTQEKVLPLLILLKASDTWSGHLSWHCYILVGGQAVICPAQYWKALLRLSGLGPCIRKCYCVEFWIMP